MRVTSLNLPPPRCLTTVVAEKPAGDLRARLVEAFISDEKDAAARALHESLGRAEPWISTRDELEVFTILCPCGGAVGKIIGVRTNDELCSPLRLACTKCGVSTMLFDVNQDGWNAEISKRKRKPRKEPKMTFAMHCKACKNTLWRSAAIVTYQGDNYADIPADTLQNYFDVMLLGGVCATCDAVDFRFGEECA